MYVQADRYFRVEFLLRNNASIDVALENILFEYQKGWSGRVPTFCLQSTEAFMT